MAKQIRLAIIGAGNCCSSLVQGIEFYKSVEAGDEIPGLMHPVLGGYAPKDIKIVAAFDIDAEKVGKDLSEAIFSGQNNTIQFSNVPKTGVIVQRGMTHDGLGKYLSQVITKAPGETVDVARILKERKVDVMIIYLPVGSEEAVKWYIEQALVAKCAVVNGIPVFIASSPHYSERFRDAGVPIVGDDFKSQFGATIVHRTLVRLMQDRGIKIDKTYQLNVGGNTDFLNMLERERLESKKISKTQAVTSQIDGIPLPNTDVHVGPSDYVPWLTDKKLAFIRLEGTTFGNVPISIELRLEVWDSPNSAGVAIDAVRAAKIALDRGISGPLKEASAWLFKSPPEQMHDDNARDAFEAWVGA